MEAYSEGFTKQFESLRTYVLRLTTALTLESVLFAAFFLRFDFFFFRFSRRAARFWRRLASAAGGGWSFS